MVSFPQVSPLKPCILPSSSHTCYMSCHLSFLGLIIRMIFGEEYRAQSSLLCSLLHPPVTSSLLGPNILLSTLFSKTLSLHSSLNVRDQVSHPYKTGKPSLLYSLGCTQGSVLFRGFCDRFVTWLSFYGEELLAPRPTPKQEDHPLSAVHDCLFDKFAATLHMYRQFHQLQPEDAPCRGDRDRRFAVTFLYKAL
jgi:hypothetical protein